MKIKLTGLFLYFVSCMVSAQTFAPRDRWDGPFDIKMIAAPNLQPVYIDKTLSLSKTIRADAVVPYTTLLMTGDLIHINNQYANSPLEDVQIPLQATLCRDSVNGCGTLGLPLRDPSTACPQRFDNPQYVTKTVAMTYSDYDADLSTYSSSMAMLDISSCSEIESAYLYWAGNFRGSNQALTMADGAVSTYSGNGNVFDVSATSGYNRTKLKVPGTNVYRDITAIAEYKDSRTYVCVANVTNLLRGLTGGGAFWVANIQSYPLAKDGGSTSGWNLVVVYRSPLSPPRLITLYDGFECVNGNDPRAGCPLTTPVRLTGLQTPAITDFKSYIGFAALDGEDLAVELVGQTKEGLGFQTNNGGPLTTIQPFRDNQPSYKLFTKKGYPANCEGKDNIDDCKKPIYDASWCSSYDGIGSSKITTYNEQTNRNGNEIVRMPSGKNTLGFDAHHMILPNGAIAPGATEATLTIRGGRQGGMQTYMAYIAIEKLQPKLVLTKKADKDQTPTNVQRQYTLTVVNKGNQDSYGGDVLTDTLDLVTKFAAGSLTSTRYVSGVASAGGIAAPVITQRTQGQELRFTIPVIRRNDSLKLIFNIDVLPVTDAVAGPLYTNQCKRTIFNTAWISYKKNSLNELLKSKSNSGECNDGSEVKILITGLGNNPRVLNAVDASAYKTQSITKHVRRQIFVQGHAGAADTASYVIYDLAGNRIFAGTPFPANSGSVTYEGYRDLSGAGCQDKITITFNFCTLPTFTVTQPAPQCQGTYNLSGAISNLLPAGATLKYYNASDTSATAVARASSVVSDSGVYYAVATYNGCSTKFIKGRINVRINKIPSAGISGGTVLCSEDAGKNLSVAITGAGPFKIEYTLPSGTAGAVINTAASPGSIPVPASLEGDFTLTRVTDNNGCFTTTFNPNKATVTRYTKLVISNPSAVCNYTTKEATVKFDVSGGKPAYTFTPSGGTFAAPSYSYKIPAAGATSYSSVVSDVTGCTLNTNVAVPGGTINCDCPVTAVITNKVNSPKSICSDGTAKAKITVTLSGSASGAAAIYRFTIKPPSGPNLTEANAVSHTGNVFEFDVADAGVYELVTASDQNCTGSVSGQATVTVSPSPAAAISNDTTLCAENTATLRVILTGTAPYKIEYTLPSGAAGPVVTAANSSGTVQVPATVAGDFTLTKVTDSSGCVTSSFIRSKATITRFTPLVITDTSSVCDFTSKNATIEFNVTGGKPAYSFFPSDGSYTAPEYSVTFPATGSTAYDYKVSDITGCSLNTNIQAMKGKIQCDCPVTGFIENKTGTSGSICNDGTSKARIAVTLSGSQSGAGAIYAFSIKTPSGGTLTEAQATANTGNSFEFEVSEEGDYVLTLVKDQNCTGSFSGKATVTVNPLPAAVIGSDTTLCTENTTALKVALTGTAPFRIEYTDPSGTAGTPVLAASASGTIQVPAAVSGDFTLTKITDDYGCIASAFTRPKATITRFTPLVIANPSAVCDFTTKEAIVRFEVTGGLPAYSFTPSTGTFTAPTYEYKFLAAGPTAYNPAVSDITGCSLNTNIAGPDSTIDCDCPVTGFISNKSGTVSSICNDGSTKARITVTVSGSRSGAGAVYTFNIKTPSGSILTKAQAVASAGNVFEYDVSEEGEYVLTSVEDQNCTGSVSGKAIVELLSPEITLGTDTVFCSDNLIGSLLASDNGTGTDPLTGTAGTIQWSTQQGPVSGSVLPRSKMTSGETVTATLTPGYTCAGTPVQASRKITIYSKPVPVLSFSKDTICPGESAILTAGGGDASLPTGYTWYKNNTVLAGNSENITVTETGTYKVLITNGLNECATEANKYLQVENVVIDAGPDRFIYKGEFAVISAAMNGAYNLSWSPAGTLSESAVLNPVARPSETTQYFVTATSRNNCTATDFVTVNVYIPVEVPNVFSPNGDGLNDEWIVKGIEKYPNTQVRIYNRWGGSVFKDDNGYRFPWNGTHNGALLPTGTYYYVIELKGSPDNTDKSVTGHLTVIR